MADMTMGSVETRFANIIWEGEPISSTELAKRSAELLGWKKSTSFTVLRRLCKKGIFKNEDGTVTSLGLAGRFLLHTEREFCRSDLRGLAPGVSCGIYREEEPERRGDCRAAPYGRRVRGGQVMEAILLKADQHEHGGKLYCGFHRDASIAVLSFFSQERA